MTEHLAGAPEAVDHLVHVQQHVVLAADRLHHRQVLVRRHRDADAGSDGNPNDRADCDAEADGNADRGTHGNTDRGTDGHADGRTHGDADRNAEADGDPDGDACAHGNSNRNTGADADARQRLYRNRGRQRSPHELRRHACDGRREAVRLPGTARL